MRTGSWWLSLVSAGALAVPSFAQTVPQMAATVDPLTKMQVPLRADERPLVLADGKCAVLPLPQRRAEWMASKRWFGGCRFGLAHGAGLIIDAKGTFWRYNATYGLLGDPSEDWYSTPGSPFEYVRAYGKPVADHPPEVDVTYSFSTSLAEDDPKRQAWQWNRRSFPCPPKNGKFERILNTWDSGASAWTPSSDEPLVAKQCASGASGATVPTIVGYRRDGAKLVAVTRVCSAPDCEETWRMLIAKDRPTILRVAAADRAWRLAYRKDLTARFAPLEAALTARLRTLAAAETRP